MYLIYEHHKQILQFGCLPKGHAFTVADGVLPGTWDKPLRNERITYIPFSLFGRFEKEISFHHRLSIKRLLLAKVVQKIMAFIFLAHTKTCLNECVGFVALSFLMMIGILGMMVGSMPVVPVTDPYEKVEFSRFISFFDKSFLSKKITYLSRDFYRGVFLEFGGAKDVRVLPLSHAGKHADDKRSFFKGILLIPAENILLIKPSDEHQTYRLAPLRNCGSYSVFIINEPVLVSFIQVDTLEVEGSQDSEEFWFYAFAADMQIAVSDPCHFIQIEEDKVL